MPGELILPTTYFDVKGPLVFLAGPIQGAPDWQTQAMALLRDLAPELHIASPRREYAPGEYSAERQVDWETHYLRRAASNGVILFWLAREVEHSCDRAYAQTTRFELAEWKVRHERDQASVVVGIEPGFSGARYIRRRLFQDCPGVPIRESLAETCQALLSVLDSRSRAAGRKNAEAEAFDRAVETAKSEQRPLRVLVTGDREWTDPAPIRRELAGLPSGSVIIHGDAGGADKLAGTEAAALGHQVIACPASWEKHGKAAGRVRNRAMLEDHKPDVVIAFHPNLPRSKGTKHMVELARAAHVPVRLVVG
jgi:hypothetical protein